MRAATSTPKVSVALPVYNGERHLPDALAGLLSQTFTDFELVIYDNASTDRTPEIAREAERRDPRVRYVRRATNIGPVENYRSSLASASAPYFAWVAHDDVWEARYLERLVAILDAKPRVVLAFSRFDNIDAQGARCATFDVDWNAVWRAPKPRQLARFILLDPAASQKANHIYGLIRREVLLESDEIFRYDGYAGSDALQLYSLLCRGDFEVAEEILFHYRVREPPAAPPGSGLTYLWKRAFGRVAGHQGNLITATRRHARYHRALAEVILERTPMPLAGRLALAALAVARGAERIAVQIPTAAASELRWRGARGLASRR